MTGAQAEVDQRADADADPRGLMSIGRLARVTGVSSRTIRYYEELGILPTPTRSPGGTRKYPEEYRYYIEGALALKELGFTLEEIKLLGWLAIGRPMAAEQQRRAAQVIRDKMRLLEHKIRVLRRLHDSLGDPDQGMPAEPSASHPLKALLREDYPPLAS